MNSLLDEQEEEGGLVKTDKHNPASVMFEFQVFYRVVADSGRNDAAHVVARISVSGELKSILVRAETPEEAAALVCGPDECVKIVSVGPGRAIIDWNQKNFSRQEAAVFLRSDVSLVDKLGADGKLPKALKGKPIFTKRMLEEVIEKRMVTGP